MNTLFYHPTGNANVRSALRGLYDAGILVAFHTAIATYPDSALDKLSKIGPFAELNRRRFDPALKNLTHQHPWYEIGRMVATKAKLKELVKHEYGRFSVDAVYQQLDQAIAEIISTNKVKNLDAVYAYEDGAATTFKVAKKAGISTLYDLPIGYWRVAQQLMEREKEIWPEWAPTLTGTKNSLEKLARKDEELRLADQVFVASRFTASTLKQFPEKLAAPVKVIPYGFPLVIASRDYDINLNKRPLKLLFVGGLSQRKGIANLFEAVKPLKGQVELTIVGRKGVNDCAALDAALKLHHWIPTLSHPEILSIMRESDVLIFPSLFEGFGLVITEAMSQGTPVITTDRTAGPDLINHNENGWLVEAGSTKDLRSAIENLIQNPELIAKAGEAAMKSAKLRPWEVYGIELANAILAGNKKDV